MLKTKKYRVKIALKVFEVMKSFSTSLSKSEIDEKVSEELQLTESQKQETYKSGVQIYKNLVGWAILGLKSMGLIRQVRRGVWELTEKGRLKVELSSGEYLAFQSKYWSEKISKKRKKKNRAAEQKSMIGLSELELKILDKVLEQNNRIIEKILDSK